jgi:anaerobic C4-dicarboxylate transporter
MDILNLIIAIVALIIALLALQRAGGVKDLKKTTAEILRKWEQKMREEKASETEQEKKE